MCKFVWSTKTGEYSIHLSVLHQNADTAAYHRLCSYTTPYTIMIIYVLTAFGTMHALVLFVYRRIAGKKQTSDPHSTV